MIQETLQFATDELDAGNTVALLTVTATRGSSPASAGQMMAVTADGRTSGTVGGGASEYRLARQAVEAMQKGEASFTFSLDHSEEGMVCGGGMEGYGAILGAGPKLVLFGGGHVAQKIAPLAASVGFSVQVVEDRAALEGEFPNARFALAQPEQYAQSVTIDKDTYVVICTRGHRTDDDALRYCLNKPFAYLGMIGSKRKVATLFSALRKEGVPEELLSKIYAPVGLDIATGSPAEIAVAVVAEMLLIKNKGTPRHLRDAAQAE